MPRVKFDYVVSFSSEDPDNQAANLLAGEVSKKKWLCKKGEPSCSVVLQLPRAIEISAVHIGAYHAALVEVLVGLSERPSDSFQVLVPSCVFVAPAQSRRDEGVARVRSFTGEELAGDTRGRRYDRVRVVCSQPYNKHCQYGLSFIHIHEPESRNDPPPVAPTAPAVPSRMFSLDTYSSDEDEFRPGELFAKHLKSPNNSESPGTTNTGAQIRQATSHALKNISDSTTNLLRTPISKAGSSRHKQTDETPTNRQRDSIMYTDDDAKPHGKIDRVVNRHKDEKTKGDELNKTKVIDKDKSKDKKDGASESSKKVKDSENRNNKANNGSPIVNTSRTKKEQLTNQQRKVPENQSSRKRKRSDDSNTDPSLVVGKVCDDQSQVLRGVKLALSGYAGAQRASLRDTALALGARYSPDWTPQCTHLICAFPNTPKMRTARACGKQVGVATADWLQECHAHRRRLPWRWFATDPTERVPAQPLPQDSPSPERNTDDEIEEAMMSIRTDARRSRYSTPSPEAAKGTSEDAAVDSDVSFVKDERFVGHVSLNTDDDSDLTDVENYVTIEETIDASKALPDFFEGYTFVVLDEVIKKSERELLDRYVRAFGGLVIAESEMDDDTQVDYVVCSDASLGKKHSKGVRVRPSWVWHCARERRMCAVDDHIIH